MRLDASDITDLRPFIATAVAETLAALEQNGAKLHDDRLAFTESEAAAALGIRPHVLRDCRLRGEITARKCGKRYLYARPALLAWLGGRKS